MDCPQHATPLGDALKFQQHGFFHQFGQLFDDEGALRRIFILGQTPFAVDDELDRHGPAHAVFGGRGDGYIFSYQQVIPLDMIDDAGLQNLLDLAGSVIDQGEDYWVKIEAWSVAPSLNVPHGIRYASTLHEPYGKRILGYDNAHAVKPPQKFKFAGQRLTYDHKHRHASDQGVPYTFSSAYQLLSDFFAEVDQVLKLAKLK